MSEETIWQWRSKYQVKHGNSEWNTPAEGENPSNPKYRERWANEYEFRPMLSREAAKSNEDKE